jgi:CheY-like chemotaxis protein
VARILIVDDEPLMAATIQSFSSHADVAMSGSEALRLVTTFRPTWCSSIWSCRTCLARRCSRIFVSAIRCCP